MQTLANISSSRDVLKQSDINLSSNARLKPFYQSYRAALNYQLQQSRTKMADYIFEANNTTAAILAAASMANTANQSAATTTVNTAIPERQKSSQFMLAPRSKSLRNSMYVGGSTDTSLSMESVNRKVEELVVKVLQHNDRLVDSRYDFAHIHQIYIYYLFYD
jgi:hypothetical protein